jgi:beta-lactamase class A
MKVALLVALYRSGLDLDAPVEVRAEFDSVAGGRYRLRADNDPVTWRRLGHRETLRWLARRMIVASSNVAANLVLARVGLPAVADVWRLAGARHSVVRRGIEDPAPDVTNLVTAADLAALLGALVLGGLAPPSASAGMLDVLCAQERTEDLAAGLPAGTRIAHKNGWVRGVRHAAGVVFPADAPPFTLAVCTTTTLSDADACALIAEIAAAAWAARHTLGGPDPTGQALAPSGGAYRPESRDQSMLPRIQ